VELVLERRCAPFPLAVSVYEKQSTVITSVLAEPSELLKVGDEFIHWPGEGFDLHAGKVSVHIARNMYQKVRFSSLVWSVSKVRMTTLINFPTQVKRKVCPLTPHLMVKLIAVHTFSVNCVGICHR
jgi:hypothetical protein